MVLFETTALAVKRISANFFANQKFQQAYKFLFKVDLLYNFNYCSRFNLQIINS